MGSTITDELDSWRAGLVADLQARLTDLTVRIAARALLGVDIAANETGRQLRRSFEVVLAWINHRFNRLSSPPAALPIPRNRAMLSARSQLRTIVRGVIAERRAAGAAPMDVLQLLLDRQALNGSPSDDQIVHECVGFLFAGHEKTASTLAWALYSMAVAPDIQERVAAEGDRLAEHAPSAGAVDALAFTGLAGFVLVQDSGARGTNGDHVRRFAVLCGAMIALSAAAVPAIAATATGALPAAPGTGLATNHDAEPGIGVAPDGALWATAFSVHDPRGGGQDIWRSTDGGSGWRWIAAPFNTPGVRLGGSDADLSVAPARNARGRFNVYAASLYVLTSSSGLLVGDISLAVSMDDGGTWILHPLAAEVPADDRPWIVAEGPCRVHLTYHAGPTVANVVNTYDLCNPAAIVQGLTLTPVAATRYASLAGPAALGRRATYVTAGFGKPVMDRGRLVIPAMDCPGLTLDQEIARAEHADADCPAGTNAELYVEVADPASASWTLRPVTRSARRDVAIWPVSAAVDGRGRLYLAWTDDVDSWLQRSDDGGATWSAPRRLNPIGATAVYPSVAAAGDGTVIVAWYQADRRGNANDAGAMRGARWSLRWAGSRNAGRSMAATSTADPLIHTGVLCTKGDACARPNSRNLFDDFGAAINPDSRIATVVYTSDQPGGVRADDVTRFVTGWP